MEESITDEEGPRGASGITGVEALSAMRDGRVMRRAAWMTGVTAEMMDKTIITTRRYGAKWREESTELRVSQLLHDDWEVVE